MDIKWNVPLSAMSYQSKFTECIALFIADLDVSLEESQVEVAFSMDINELGLNCMGHVSQLRWDGTQPFLSNDPPIEQRHDRYLYMTNWQRLDELKRAEADQKKLNLSPW